ncbi:LBP_cg2779 family protein [Pediococcus parvulus]|uniref:LBP_cg2779 family protein n=1 Tax=Pediococcus parvulus TaxID=54062 RepID=UPI003D039027
MNDLTKLAEEIVGYQKKHDLTDADVAFGTHLSVEKIHNIKINSYKPTADDIQRINNYMRDNNK